jgi:hypothetical protein
MRSPISLSPFTLLNIVIALFFLIVIVFDRQFPVGHFSAAVVKDFHVDCNMLMEQLGSIKESGHQEGVSRFAPNEGRLTRLDNDAFASPQVFKVFASFLEPNTQRVLTSHCQAIYTDRSKAYGNHVVEMPAHCFVAQAPQEQLTVSPNMSPTTPPRLIAPLNNYCVYMGENIRQPEAVFTPQKIACKSEFLRSRDDLALDSCMVYLDRPVPDSIVDKPLVWWRPSEVPSKVDQLGSSRISDENTFLPVEKSAGQQLMALLGAQVDKTSCNIDSGNLEGSLDLQMISHSIDYDGIGVQRVTSFGKPIYHHASQGVILSASHIPNTVDTRAGDSGGAVVIMQGDEKILIGMQVAIMLSNSREKKPPFAVRNERDSGFKAGSVQSRLFNLAINPHLDKINTYRYVFYAEVRDTMLDQ